MSSPHDAEVIVVGGGPGGAAAAWTLARGGRDVLVLDRAGFPRAKPCAEYVSPEAGRILEAMGVMDDVVHAGASRLEGMMVRAPDGTQLVGEFGRARELVGNRTNGIALRRERLDPILLGAARNAGARIEERAHVVDVFRGTSGRVSGVVMQNGEVRRARFVVGADGLRSVVARRIGVGSRSRWPSRIAFVAHYEGVEGMRNYGEMHVDAEGYVGLASVDNGLVNVAVVIPAAHGRDAAGDPSEFIRRWIASRPHLAPRFAAARALAPARGIGPFAWGTRRAWVHGAALVGDAADFFDPFTGEGIYAALRGAELLEPYAHAACVARGVRDEEEALRAYDRCRRDNFLGKWTVERLVGFAVAWPGFMNRIARGLARRRDLADTFVGVTGDVVPASAVLRPSYILALAHASFF
jgi:flavin-dependent dehydrogenase